MKIRSTKSMLFAVALLALAALLFPTSALDAQDGCHTWCYDGDFDYAFLTCVPVGFLVDRTHCQVSCPRGGGSDVDPLYQH